MIERSDQINFIIKKVRKRTESSLNINTKSIDATRVVEKIYVMKKVDTGGMSLMRKNAMFQILEQTVKSNKDMLIVSFILNGVSKRGTVLIDKKKAINATTSSIASKFDVSNRKVRGLISELKKLDAIIVIKKDIYVNPFLVLPYGSSEENSQLLQLRWEDGFIHTDDELLEIYAKETVIEEEEYK